jgi:hypothetical protein
MREKETEQVKLFTDAKQPRAVSFSRVHFFGPPSVAEQNALGFLHTVISLTKLILRGHQHISLKRHISLTQTYFADTIFVSLFVIGTFTKGDFGALNL